MKKPQNSTKKEPMSVSLGKKSVKELLFSYRERGYSEAQREKIKELFWEWAQKDDSLQLYEFYYQLGIHEQGWKSLIDKHEDMKELHEYVKMVIGMRREKLAWFNKLDAKLVSSTLRIYNSDFRMVYEEDKAARIEMSKESSSNINVVVDQIPNSSEVPVKVKGE